MFAVHPSTGAALTRTLVLAPPTGTLPLSMKGASQSPVAELMVSCCTALVPSSYCSVYLGEHASRLMRFCSKRKHGKTSRHCCFH